MNSTEFILDRLKRPEGIVDIILDTDTYNEIDDQFALAYMLKSPDKFNVRAVCAAPFFNGKSSSPQDGMERSYDEIIKLLDTADMKELFDMVYKGSTAYLADENTPFVSPAAQRIVQIAMSMPDDKPLYVVAIGAITNVASAIIMQPEIIKKIVVVWLGGHSLEWHDTAEFNMMQDIAAARVILSSSVPVVLLPCMGVVSHLATTEPELRHWLLGKNALATYLAQNTIDEANSYACGKPWSRVIWDISAIAWFMGDDFTLSRFEHSPVPSYDNYYTSSKTRHLIRYVYGVNRDAIFEDMFRRLGA